MSDKQPMIIPAEMCKKHRQLLVHQAGYSPKDPWQSLIIVSQIALFQAAAADERTHEIIGDDITRIGELGCLACYKPDAFGELVEIAKSHDLGRLKELGEKWITK
jgi:hypothetical protein